MGLETIQHILKTVEQPSRYIGNEINSIKKDHARCKLKFALAFPDLYEIGTSHFGIQILYHILNAKEDVVAERVFAPALDMEEALRNHGIPMFSLESQTALTDFDIVGFSLLYELNYTNVLTILDLAGIPFLSSDRDDSHPLVIAGGPCMFNPEPVADIFDVIIVGDGEQVIQTVSDLYIGWKNKPDATKHDLLNLLSDIEGIYIPSFFEPDYIQTDAGSLQVLNAKKTDYQKINKAIVPDLESEMFPCAPVIPFGKPVHDRLRLEISRGCSRGCRFCQAGMIYRPVRERKVESLLDISEKAVKNTGYEDISLLSLSTGDYANLNCLMLNLMDNTTRDINEHLSVSLPSVRAGKLNSDVMEIIRKERKTGFTIAPEAGTQKLRDSINKGLDEDDILNTVQSAFELGWKTIKLYFMIGLPGETPEDLQGIVDLVNKLRKLKQSKGKRAQINVSVSTYIPKAHTPFQWENQISEEESWEKIQWLKHNLRMPGVNFKWGHTGISFLEGIMSRGDRRLTPMIINAYNKGCRFDGWNEHFNLDLWQKAANEESINPEFYIERYRNTDEPLPWDHIDSGIEKQFLQNELDRSRQYLLTEDCKTGKCYQCGICDFKSIKPVVEDKIDYRHSNPNKTDGSETPYHKLLVNYTKTDNAKYFGHLELINIFSKALRRTGIPVKYTSGHHKKIKMTFNEPLPLGYESLDEYFIIEVKENFDTTLIFDLLKNEIPDGLTISSVKKINSKKQITTSDRNILYSVSIKEFHFSESKLDIFTDTDNFSFTKINKKGKHKLLNLKNIIANISIRNSDTIHIELKVDGDKIRPYDAVQAIFSVPDSIMIYADIKKLGKL